MKEQAPYVPPAGVPSSGPISPAQADGLLRDAISKLKAADDPVAFAAAATVILGGAISPIGIAIGAVALLSALSDPSSITNEVREWLGNGWQEAKKLPVVGKVLSVLD